MTDAGLVRLEAHRSADPPGAAGAGFTRPGGDDAMWRTNHFGTWVVYRMTFRAQDAPVNAVCEQGEWAEMEAAHPGRLVLVRSGMRSEGEAERLARGTSGDPVPRAHRPPAKRPAVGSVAAVGRNEGESGILLGTAGPGGYSSITVGPEGSDRDVGPTAASRPVLVPFRAHPSNRP